MDIALQVSTINNISSSPLEDEVCWTCNGIHQEDRMYNKRYSLQKFVESLRSSNVYNTRIEVCRQPFKNKVYVLQTLE
jgi:hypothetical protein